MKETFRKILLLLLAAPLLCAACSSDDDGAPGPVDPPLPPAKNDGYERSYWIDMDLAGAHLRGYWYNVADYAEAETPSAEAVAHACATLSGTYHADKLYLIYHRQYEPEKAKTVLQLWKNHADEAGLEVVPTLVLQSYASPQQMNFTDDEATAFAAWCGGQINPDELGIYDVYTRDAVGSAQDLQLKKLRDAVGDRLVRIGLQPGVALNAVYRAGVEDTWTAECQGLTNELWEHPVYYRGHRNYGRRLLENWVKARIEGDTRPIVWDMIPVAWDYDTGDDLSYDSPGDDALRNDPPVPGRIALCHKYISACYALGVDDPLFGGYSCDLHILQANSAGRGESPSFYEALRTGIPYTGDFAAAMLEIGALYESLTPSKP